jgi:hypothetical protein
VRSAKRSHFTALKIKCCRLSAIAHFGRFKSGCCAPVGLSRLVLVFPTRRLTEWSTVVHFHDAQITNMDFFSTPNKTPKTFDNFPHYQTLDPGKICVILLQPGAEHAPIQCKIVECDLEYMRSTYDALSYVWGMQWAESLSPRQLVYRTT